VTAAAADKTNLASSNGGHPTNLAVTKPLQRNAYTAGGLQTSAAQAGSELAKQQHRHQR